MNPVLAAHLGRLRERHPAATVRLLNGGAALVTVPALSLPPGWLIATVTLHFLAPNGYPAAAPDCFWTEPELMLPGNRPPRNSNVSNKIPEASITAHWFSWHVEQGQWSPNCHDLLTWLQLCLRRLQTLE